MLSPFDYFKPAILQLDSLKLSTVSDLLFYDSAFEILRSMVNLHELQICNLYISDYSFLALRKLDIRRLALDNIVTNKEAEDLFIENIFKRNINSLRLFTTAREGEKNAFPEFIHRFINEATTYNTMGLRYLTIQLADYSKMNWINLDKMDDLQVLIIYYPINDIINVLRKFRPYLWLFKEKEVILIEYAIKLDSMTKHEMGILEEHGRNFTTDFEREYPEVNLWTLERQRKDNLVNYLCTNYENIFT